MRAGVRTDLFVGREAEVRRLRGLADGLVKGRGASALVEGEPGIGKSALLAAALADAERRGCELLWAEADEVAQRFPLQVMLDCLRVDPRSTDPARAEVAALLRGDGEVAAGIRAAGDTALAMMERLMDLVDRLCAASPVVLVVDDLQWADEASLLMWQRLCRTAEQAPLLLLGTCRPVPQRAEVDQLRRVLRTRGGVLLSLGPLPPDAVAELVGALVKAEPGPALLHAAERGAGNPLYVRELVDALRREHAVRMAEGRADVPDGTVEPPASLSAVLADRLSFLPRDVRDVLRSAALLGSEFSIGELAAATNREQTDLIRNLAEAVAAGVVDGSGVRLRFRHALIRQAMQDAIPPALREATRRQLARALSASGAPPERVAQQLLTAVETEDSWTLEWLAGNAAALVYRAPRTACDLLEHAVAQVANEPARRLALQRWLVTAAFHLARHDQLERHARRVLSDTDDPELVAEVSWMLAYTLMRHTRYDEATDLIREATAGGRLSAAWSCRLRALDSLMLLHRVGGNEDVEVSARRVLAEAERVGDRSASGYALHTLSASRILQGDHRAAVPLLDQALAVLGDDPQTTDLRLMMLTNRGVTLGYLDRFDDAHTNFYECRVLAERTGSPRLGNEQLYSAQAYYENGRWDDARAELGSIVELTDNQHMLLGFHGISAVIAVHRDEMDEALDHIAALKDWKIDVPGYSRVNSDFLLCARAALAERQGQPGQALEHLAPTVTPECDADYGGQRHEWLAQIVRLALEVGEVQTARAAVQASERDADRHGVPASAAAARRCRAILEQDPDGVLATADYYRGAGRPFPLAETLEDAAVLFAQRGAIDVARRLLTDAVEVYRGLDAVWDIVRADARIRPYGVRRGHRGPHRRAASGWEALTPTEVKVARIVARGASNPEIAAELFLSRRTIQTHVSHILTKLGARSRVEIAQEVAGHRVGAD